MAFVTSVGLDVERHLTSYDSSSFEVVAKLELDAVPAQHRLDPRPQLVGVLAERSP